MWTTGFFRGEHFVPEKEIPDLDGQVYVVTGGTKGIGYGIVHHLLLHNAAKIILLSSSEVSARQAMEALVEVGDVSRVTWKKCNLKALKDVDKVAKSLREDEPRIDSLILNAGIGVGKFSLTDDGIDSHMQINVISQLHLALMLLPTMRKTSVLANQPSRLIMMTSEMHRFAPSSTKFESVQELNTNVGSTFLYSRSKLAQIVIVKELVRRADAGQLGFDGSNDVRKQVLMNATHPGGVRTAQQEQLVPAYGWVGWLVMHLLRVILVDPIQVGCLTGLFASTLTAGLLENGGLQGEYIVPDKQVSRPHKKACDKEMGKNLWNVCLALLTDKVGSLDYEFELAA